MSAPHPATMRAAIIAAPGEVSIKQVPVPSPAPNEVLVRLSGCGVCASNLSPWEGQPWFTYPMEPGALGHEGWGTVEAVGGQVDKFDVGDHVAMLSGHAYAEYDVADTQSLVKLPEEWHDRAFPGEPLGCAVNIFRRSGIKSGDTVAIVGIGFLGALLTRFASQAGARVIAIGRRPYALEVAKKEGAAETILMDDHWRIMEAVKALTNGIFCDVVIEAVGKQWPLDLAGELTRERGRLIVAGYHQDGLRQINMQLWNWRGIDVINAHEREQVIYIDGIRAAAAMLSAGELDPEPLFTHRYTLEDLGTALDATRDRPNGFMKALIVMQPTPIQSAINL